VKTTSLLLIGACASPLEDPQGHRITNLDHVPTGGDGRVGDWAWHGDDATLILRAAGTSLTQLGSGGGTLVDLSLGGQDDGIAEAIPLPMLSQVSISLREDGFDVAGWTAEGTAALHSWRLVGTTLHLEGAEGLRLVPLAGMSWTGTGFVDPDGARTGLGSDGTPTDHGGWVDLAGATTLELHSPTPPEAPAEEAQLWVQVEDGEGSPIPATLWWNGEAHPIPAGGGAPPLAELSGSGRVEAGPAHEALPLEGPLGPTLEAVLSSVPGARLWTAVDLRSWPDRTVRQPPAGTVDAQAARGVRIAVVTAADEVGSFATLDPAWIAGTGGSMAQSGGPRAWAFPWTANGNRGAHGAAPAGDLDPVDLVAAMDKHGDRLVIVSTEWVEAAGAPWTWDPAPAALMIESPEDVDLAMDLWDRWVPLQLAGATGWIPDGEGWLDLAAAITGGSFVPSNGPDLELTVDDGLARMAIRMPGWMPATQLELLGTGAVVLGTWALEPGTSTTVQLPTRGQSWLAARLTGLEGHAWLDGEAPFAVAGPVWMRRP
jgi:hypothetical protein